MSGLSGEGVEWALGDWGHPGASPIQLWSEVTVLWDFKATKCHDWCCG